jgi:8-oxo-dGTP pyrophosphatase MutT (NUDIX family)
MLIVNKIQATLSARLTLPLPGFESQQRMMPESRNLIPVSNHTPAKSAVLILLYPHGQMLHFALIKRPSYNGYHSGQMALPGGKHEATDTDLIDTALREFCEETGVPVPRAQVLGPLTELLIPISNITVLPVVATYNALPDFSPNKTEVAELFSIPLTFLKTLFTRSRKFGILTGIRLTYRITIFTNKKCGVPPQ